MSSTNLRAFISDFEKAAEAGIGRDSGGQKDAVQRDGTHRTDPDESVGDPEAVELSSRRVEIHELSHGIPGGKDALNKRDGPGQVLEINKADIHHHISRAGFQVKFHAVGFFLDLGGDEADLVIGPSLGEFLFTLFRDDPSPPAQVFRQSFPVRPEKIKADRPFAHVVAPGMKLFRDGRTAQGPVGHLEYPQNGQAIFFSFFHGSSSRGVLTFDYPLVAILPDQVSRHPAYGRGG